MLTKPRAREILMYKPTTAHRHFWRAVALNFYLKQCAFVHFYSCVASADFRFGYWTSSPGAFIGYRNMNLQLRPTGKRWLLWPLFLHTAALPCLKVEKAVFFFKFVNSTVVARAINTYSVQHATVAVAAYFDALQQFAHWVWQILMLVLPPTITILFLSKL